MSTSPYQSIQRRTSLQFTQTPAYKIKFQIPLSSEPNKLLTSWVADPYDTQAKLELNNFDSACFTKFT
jgi:hypothetical protein